MDAFQGMMVVYILDAVFGGTLYGDYDLENGHAVPIAFGAFQAMLCWHGGDCYLTFPFLPCWPDLLVRCCTKEGAVAPLLDLVTFGRCDTLVQWSVMPL